MRTRTAFGRQPLSLFSWVAVIAAFVGGISLGVARRARSGAPDNLPDALQYARPAKQGGWSNRTILDANTTTYAIHQSLGANTAHTLYPACFLYGSALDVTSSAEVTCCWTNTTTVTLGDQTSALATYITDTSSATGSGYGSCHTLQANDRYVFIPDFPSLHVSGAVTKRKKLCSKPQQGRNDMQAGAQYPPCLVDGDCTTARIGSFTDGTCTNKANQDTRLPGQCAFLVCKATNASTKLTVTVTR
jgi:hypothetical protein